MGYPFGKINTFSNQCAIMVLFLMPGFLVPSRCDANAFPVFCRDINPYQESILTGCNLNAGLLSLPYGSPV